MGATAKKSFGSKILHLNVFRNCQNTVNGALEIKTTTLNDNHQREDTIKVNKQMQSFRINEFFAVVPECNGIVFYSPKMTQPSVLCTLRTGTVIELPQVSVSIERSWCFVAEYLLYSP